MKKAAAEKRALGKGGTKAKTAVVKKKGQVMTEPSAEFVITPHVEEITERALTYLDAGYPVHFAGPAGIGKTTLAFHVASQRQRSITLLHGNDDYETADLVGKENGYRKSLVVDNFIHSVIKREEEMTNKWVESRLTTACRRGDTLIYDEFNRSRPEANNILLSVLAEGILTLPGLRDHGAGYLDVHPHFSAIFTSNPEEYAGTHKTQDALMDRMITIRVDHPDRETEINIVTSKSKVERSEAAHIVDVVRELRDADGNNKARPAIRSAIAIGKVLALRGEKARWGNPFFHSVCYDILSIDAPKIVRGGQSVIREMIDDVIEKSCPSYSASTKRRPNVA